MNPSTSAPGAVLVLNFGAQYAQLIARQVRACGVYCEVVPAGISADDAAARQPAGLILSGGPSSAYGEGAPIADPAIYNLGVPVLGICYGQQLMAMQLGGDVEKGGGGEYGQMEITVTAPGRLFAGYAPPGTTLSCFMSHGDVVDRPPKGFTVTAVSASAHVAAMECTERGLYGVQFHPEVQHTPFGGKLLQSFLIDICGCDGNWQAANFVEQAIEQIRRQVGAAGVLCGVSGGVDSCCLAALLQRAIGSQLHCVFVDHGLLRKGEADLVRAAFSDALRVPLQTVEAAEHFLGRLSGVIDPEEKRKAIARAFEEVFKAEAAKLPGVRFLAQGTLYPDVIESGAGDNAATIKTHHNLYLSKQLGLELVEPLRNLFKDEVRAAATELGLPQEMVRRHPFPGPGLAIRILGEVTRERLAILREADAIFIEELRSAGLYDDVWQALAVLPAIQSVGVQGDERTYGYPLVLRAVTSRDAMTAEWSRLPWELLERVSRRVVNEVKAINRVVYDITSKPPGTIEWE
ncbi:MAG: glutamine-hydrolyzing GMP synthase [Armatimonadetes bacterium]|nr:glutamine-hydrolyzing GMP synthase [Armatimonadota bacterium]MDE2205447.1 glutamine-hydrolyzing GMP synthase [Armatimonadota bacterium]